MDKIFLSFANGASVPLAEIPQADFEVFRRGVVEAVTGNGRRVSAFFALPEADGGFTLFAVLLDPASHRLEAAGAAVGSSYRALTPDAPAFQWFEREIAESTGLRPEGHPWLKPIRFVADRAGERPTPGVTDYFTMRGTAAHEVAVGPVHAGVIEPGHFRFQCMGEDVYSLEIELGYQHRGIEKMLLNGPDGRTIHLIETAAGDTTASSAYNYARIIESLSGAPEVPKKAQVLRTLALELERIANHVGDLGALAGDVAFLTTASYCGRIRGEFLNMTATLCGNRFGRGYIIPGGTRFAPTAEEIAKITGWFDRTWKELSAALDLMFDSPGVLDRLENTGTVSCKTAGEIGMVGVAGRASNLALDARKDVPYGLYGELDFSACPMENGDVLARAQVRRAELAESRKLVCSLLASISDGDFSVAVPERLAPSMLAVSVTEAWRGELVHAALTDGEGRFRSYRIYDPSFHNWFGLSLALRGEQISNFPICNKSFNLSYCGHDL